MNRKTLTALLLFAGLLAAAYFLLTRPEKGQRIGERKRPLAKLVAAKINQVTITGKGTTVVLAKDGKDGWKLIKPVVYAADKYAAETMIDRLEKLEFGDLVTEARTRHGEYEVDDKSGLHLVATDGTKPLADFYLGRVIDDFTMLRLAGSEQVYQAVGSLRFIFERETKNWRRRNIIDFKQEELRRLAVTSGGGTVALARTDEKSPWRVERAPPEAQLDQLDEAAISSLSSTLYALAAFDFADGVDPARSGLDKPGARVTAQLKSGPPLTLLIGGHQGDDYWVQREGSPQVFVIKKYTVDNLARRAIDFRDKTVLSFKQADVVALTMDKRKDKESVKLTPRGSDAWLGNGKPIKDPSKIKPALEALTALKAEGFATQTAAELGLDKPDWVIEIQLKDRTKHQLTIGSVEKDGVYGLQRQGRSEIFTVRKYTLDRICLEPKHYK